MLEEDLRLHAGLAAPIDDTKDYEARTFDAVSHRFTDKLH